MAFPGIFRGALDVQAKEINEEMKLAAVHAIAGLISDEELQADYVIPDPFDRRVAAHVAAAVAKAAMETGVAGKLINPEKSERAFISVGRRKNSRFSYKSVQTNK